MLTQSLDTLTLSDKAYFEWLSFLETSSGIENILAISGGINNLQVVGNSNVTYYEQPQGPASDINELVELSVNDILSNLTSDLADGTLDDPLLLTIYYPDFPTPSEALFDDQLIAAGLDLSVSDADSVTDVPTPIPLFGAAVAFSYSRMLRRRIQSCRTPISPG